MDNNYEAYQYAGLIVKHLNGKLTAAEEIRLQEWLDLDPQNAELLEKLQKDDFLKKDLDFFNAVDKETAWQNIVAQTLPISLTDKVFLFVQKWKYAAVLLLSLSVAVVFYNSKKAIEKTAGAIAHMTRYKHDIAPGVDGAVLTLNDGSHLVLDARHPKALKTVKGVAGNWGSKYQEFNTVTTPSGFKYKLILPDGSRVWLNASSSIKFPVAFTRSERRVYLTGEAYFEVSKNKHKPFKVIANNTIVQVLGTHFNVRAYGDDNDVKATLLEGSIKIFKGKQSRLVIPGQQALVVSNSPEIEIKDANLDQSVAWKNDTFLFESEDIRSVMKQISRWYNVEVDYKDNITPFHFSGKVSRNNNISQILNMLELTGGVHFEIEGRKIIVTR